VVVNWPTHGVSLYDLANITDVFANAWSSAGREMAWLGLPVILYAHDLTLYPSDLNYVGTTRAEYFEKIQQALTEVWSCDWIRKTYRWCAVDLYYSSLDISESFSKDEHRSVMQKGFGRIFGLVAPAYEIERDCRKRAAKLSISGQVNRIMEEGLAASIDLDGQAEEVSYAQETVFLKREVRRLVMGLYGPSQGADPNSLVGRLLNFAKS
jgi:hypothetical protein